METKSRLTWIDMNAYSLDQDSYSRIDQGIDQDSYSRIDQDIDQDPNYRI